jgi:hypothetical protein
MTMSQKDLEFNEVLVSAKKALDSIGVPFHLHAGTSLGAHRERAFIPHDHDIDVGVFYKDANTPQKLEKIEKALIKNGFDILGYEGILERGYELQVEKNGIGLDLFWVYEGEYRGKKYYLISSYYGECDKLVFNTCVWGYRPYRVQNIDFLGHKYKVVPKKTLVDMYGKDWKTPKKFGYFEGITSGGYKGFLKDYYNPRPTGNNVAFCFLLYDTVKHNKIWTTFFSQDNYPIQSYNIYTHLKEVTDKTPDWVKRNKIRGIKTGWCEENLVWAWIKLLRAALENKDNQYFTILSGECIPLFNYEETYKNITSSNKSRINIDYDAEVTIDTGLLYADQWILLTRKDAELLVKLKTTEAGKKFAKKLKLEICTGDVCYCPDEVYPINWFVHNYGSPNSAEFKKHFRVMPTTYTFWDGKKPHPIKFQNPKMLEKKKTICQSGAIFGRKFNPKAARCLALKCGVDYGNIGKKC